MTYTKIYTVLCTVKYNNSYTTISYYFVCYNNII